MVIKRVLISAGGTGGHLYPAQGLAQQLKKQTDAPEVLFVAGGLGSNRYFDKKAHSFEEIATSPLLFWHPLKTIKGVACLFKGMQQSIAIIKRYQPDVVVGFGSYYTVPTLLAAKWLKIPIVLHEGNSVPGKANKWLASFATSVGVHFPTTATYFKKGKTVEVGLPLREGYSLHAITKENALHYYGLSPQFQTLLICGGSQGAQAINQFIKECMITIKKLSLQIIHLTGSAKSTEELNSLYHDFKITACVKDFESNMQMAWRAADGFLGRAGASTIAESIEFEIPGILIPFPYATDNHQEKNADFLVNTVGSAIKLMEFRIHVKDLNNTIEKLFEKNQFQVFKNAIKKYKQRPHQMTLCQLINTIK